MPAAPKRPPKRPAAKTSAKKILDAGTQTERRLGAMGGALKGNPDIGNQTQTLISDKQGKEKLIESELTTFMSVDAGKQKLTSNQQSIVKQIENLWMSVPESRGRK